MSPSSRRAWVEIGKNTAKRKAPGVALLTEGVGRNQVRFAFCMASSTVALLTEGVGRNLVKLAQLFQLVVALLTEGVGRNIFPHIQAG